MNRQDYPSFEMAHRQSYKEEPGVAAHDNVRVSQEFLPLHCFLDLRCGLLLESHFISFRSRGGTRTQVMGMISFFFSLHSMSRLSQAVPILLLAAGIAACGEVVWLRCFPEYHSKPCGLEHQLLGVVSQ